MNSFTRGTVAALVGMIGLHVAAAARQSQSATLLPTSPMQFGLFLGQFNADATFKLEGKDWTPLSGIWRSDGPELTLINPAGSPECIAPGRYRFHVENARVRFQLVSDACAERRMVLDGSTWRPRGEVEPLPARRIVRTEAKQRRPLPPPAPAAGSWPSFRGPQAAGVAVGQNLPER